jgi:two-component system phosphate regulon response regulator PhoB
MSKGKILLVGSGDYDVTRVLQLYLDAHGFDARAISQNDEALVVCRQSPPDAIILYPTLLDVGCYDLCRQIRADKQTRHVFILTLLPTEAREIKLAALEAGADDVMTTPIDIEQVRLRIEGVIGPCSS